MDLSQKSAKEMKELIGSFETTLFYTENDEVSDFCKEQIANLESQIIIRKAQEKVQKSEQLAYEAENYLELFAAQDKKMYQSERLKSKAQAKFFVGKLRRAVKAHQKLGLKVDWSEDKIEELIFATFFFEGKEATDIYISYGSNGYIFRYLTAYA